MRPPPRSVGGVVASPELVTIWNGNGFYVKTYQDTDGYYYSVMMSPDFLSEEQAKKFNGQIIQFVRNIQHGTM